MNRYTIVLGAEGTSAKRSFHLDSRASLFLKEMAESNNLSLEEAAGSLIANSNPTSLDLGPSGIGPQHTILAVLDSDNQRE